jgi:hypothetical protein
MNQRGFILPTFNIYGVLFGIIVALSFALTYFIHQTRSIQNEYAQYKADVLAQQKILADETERRRVESERVSLDTATGWAAAVDWHRRHPRTITVRVPANCGAGEMPGLSVATEQPDAAAAEQEPSPAVITTEQCETYVNQAVLDASQVMWLQSWIRKQHEVSK